MRYRTVIVVSALAGLALAAPTSAQAETLNLEASADAYTLKSSATKNFGMATSLRVRDPGVRSYVKFEVSGVPSGSSVTAGTLRLHSSTGDKCTTAGLGADAYRTGSDGWSENHDHPQQCPRQVGVPDRDRRRFRGRIDRHLRCHLGGNGERDGELLPRDALVPHRHYSWDLGSWHLIALNTSHKASSGGVPCELGPSCAEGSPQNDWLEQDLAAVPASSCVLAYWHHPLFNSGAGSGNDDHSSIKPLRADLDAAGADLIINAHEHNYQRYELMTADGIASPSGVREFISGGGGKSLDGFLCGQGSRISSGHREVRCLEA